MGGPLEKAVDVDEGAAPVAGDDIALSFVILDKVEDDAVATADAGSSFCAAVSGLVAGVGLIFGLTDADNRQGAGAE